MDANLSTAKFCLFAYPFKYSILHSIHLQLKNATSNIFYLVVCLTLLLVCLLPNNVSNVLLFDKKMFSFFFIENNYKKKTLFGENIKKKISAKFQLKKYLLLHLHPNAAVHSFNNLNSSKKKSFIILLICFHFGLIFNHHIKMFISKKKNYISIMSIKTPIPKATKITKISTYFSHIKPTKWITFRDFFFRFASTVINFPLQ